MRLKCQEINLPSMNLVCDGLNKHSAGLLIDKHNASYTQLSNECHQEAIYWIPNGEMTKYWLKEIMWFLSYSACLNKYLNVFVQINTWWIDNGAIGLSAFIQRFIDIWHPSKWLRAWEMRCCGCVLFLRRDVPLWTSHRHTRVHLLSEGDDVLHRRGGSKRKSQTLRGLLVASHPSHPSALPRTSLASLPVFLRRRTNSLAEFSGK